MKKESNFLSILFILSQILYYCQHSTLLAVIRDRISMSPASAYWDHFAQTQKTVGFKSHKSCTNQTALYTQATHMQQYIVLNFDSLLKNKERKGFVSALTRCIIGVFYNLSSHWLHINFQNFSLWPLISKRTSHQMNVRLFKSPANNCRHTSFSGALSANKTLFW